jgi:hypothetical protein
MHAADGGSASIFPHCETVANVTPTSNVNQNKVKDGSRIGLQLAGSSHLDLD